MLQLSISLPRGTEIIQENHMLTLNIDEEITTTDLWQAQLNLWLLVNGETTDTALLRVDHQEEFEVVIDSEKEKGMRYLQQRLPNFLNNTEFEHGKLVIGQGDLPTYTFESPSYSTGGLGSDLITILNILGLNGWELTMKENETTYIMKREKKKAEEA